jgi:hypothetical protein
MTYISHRSDSAHLQFRMRVPTRAAGVKGRRVIISFPHAGDEDPFFVEATIGETVKFSLRTTDPALARERDAIARAQLEKYFAAAESKLSPLSHRQKVALSGLVYELYVKTHENEPGSPSAWAAFKAFNRAACEGRCVDVPPITVGEIDDPSKASERFGEDLTAGVNSSLRAGM